MSVFGRFHPRLQEAIVARLGWTALRPVQDQAGAAILEGKNGIVLAPTAGGKTEAALFPAISLLLDAPPAGLAALYIAPLRALLNNQAERLGLYTEMVGLGRFVWHGDIPDHARRQFLREPTELLMTTPESLEVMMTSERVDKEKLFRDLRIVVIDEIHALAGSDRGAHLMSVLERIRTRCPHDFQRVGLSATVGNPSEIAVWLQGSSVRESVVVDPPKEASARELLVSLSPGLESVARLGARLGRGKKSLFFCQSRSTAEAVAAQMRQAGTEVFVHHSAVSRDERAAAEATFSHGADACIVCTSTLELGIDVGDLDRVLQHEAPDTVGAFMQRMGRTGRRAGQSANTSFLCESTDGVVQAIALIELAKTGWVESVSINERCWPVFVHQILAMALSGNGVTPAAAWNQLRLIPDFRGIREEEFHRLVNWMLNDGSLVLTSGLLTLGPRAEQKFGRRNFMELFSVFTTPHVYTVQTGNGRELGTLSQSFVDQLVDGVSCFLLGGRPWAVLRIQHDDRRILVEPAPRGKQPTWGGYLPQFLSRPLCERIYSVVSGEEELPYLDPEAAKALRFRRKEMIDVRPGAVMEGVNEVRWWTFAGGRINSTLKYALASTGADWKIVPDNFGISVRADAIQMQGFQQVRARILDEAYWMNQNLWSEIASSLPNYRLSKFQSLMPDWVEREVLSTYLLDAAGAWEWMASITQ